MEYVNFLTLYVKKSNLWIMSLDFDLYYQHGDRVSLFFYNAFYWHWRIYSRIGYSTTPYPMGSTSFFGAFPATGIKRWHNGREFFTRICTVFCSGWTLCSEQYAFIPTKYIDKNSYYSRENDWLSRPYSLDFRGVGGGGGECHLIKRIVRKHFSVASVSTEIFVIFFPVY